jgi:hypothetical protein
MPQSLNAKDEDKVSFPALRIFLAGAISGGIAKTAVAPFDRYASLPLPASAQAESAYGFPYSDG